MNLYWHNRLVHVENSIIESFTETEKLARIWFLKSQILNCEEYHGMSETHSKFNFSEVEFLIETVSLNARNLFEIQEFM